MRPLPLSLWALITVQIDALTPPPQQPLPTAIRKMPPDQGAKFYHSDCAFHNHVFAPAPERPLSPAIAARDFFEEQDARRRSANSSATLDFRPPFALSLDDDTSPARQALLGRVVLARLQKRNWSCPTGTSNCDAIGFPNSCCKTNERCVQVQDTGLGPVGCCPAGATCSGGVQNCTDGSTACASDLGGGCCVPGFICQGIGCKPPPIHAASLPPPANPPCQASTPPPRPPPS